MVRARAADQQGSGPTRGKVHAVAKQLNKNDEQRYWRIRMALACARTGFWVVWELFGPKPR